ncbi:chemotaxis protein MotD [Shinella sp. BE166]|uniref:flagellar hook-length control protein FliK n=1 Tax=Shinella sp. BE166 TaxID=3373918 RepID=UPI003EC06D00
MSTIGSGVLGVVQGHAPTKGKAAHGLSAGASEEGGFASAVASISGREGEAGRKGARLSLSIGAGEPEGDKTDETRVKLGRRDGTALNEALRNKAGADVPEEDAVPFEEKAAALLEAAGRHGRKTQGEGRNTDKVATRKTDEPAADAAEATTDTAEAASANTDVGNLLEMLAAPNAVSHAVTNGAAVKAGIAGAVQDVKTQTGGKGQAKADARADATAVKADATAAVDGADAGEVPQSDTDQLFRLIRADGKGRDLDMKLSDAGERATFRDANPTGVKGETVTVVDARRYIGLAQTGNAGAVTSAITQDPQWAASLSATGGLSHSEAAATGKVVNTLKIQMHPIELGLVTATLRLHGDALVVSLQVETGEAYRQLTDDQDAIVRALRGQGFAVDQVTVQLSPADKSANAQQGDSQNQQQQQQFSNPQAREGGNGRQGGGEQQARNFAREGMSHEGNTSENAPGLAGGQPQRTGGVYL